jgi:hypothetical protein
MAKDPAFLFYHRDFLHGTMFMDDEAVGKYIRLLCIQADKGYIPKEHMQSICNGYAKHAIIKEKFLTDDNGNFYNDRLRNEIIKRSNYITSRKNNAKAYAKHMENENDIFNKELKCSFISSTKTINKESKVFKYDFNIIWNKYPRKMGRKEAERHFNASVKTDEDFNDIQKALAVFLASKVCQGDPKFIPHGSTWFNNWRDWVDYQEPSNEFSRQKEEEERINNLIKGKK